MSLENYIEVFSGVIPGRDCDYALNMFKNYQWDLHRWSTYNKVVSFETNTELSVKPVDEYTYNTIFPTIHSCVNAYANKWGISLHGVSPLRANKYDTGTLMKKHVDHIHSVFDGEKKGIPVLSVVGLLNDDFQGGDFIFFDNYRLKLGKGDVLVFPSIFLYPHRVDQVLSGTRYSVVQWVY